MQKHIFFLLFPIFIFAQSVTFSGKVIDAKTQEILPGASIYIPSTSIGTTTDFNGNFSLQLPIQAKEIVISNIGFTTVNVPLNISEGNNLKKTIRLRESSTNLKELIIRKQEINAEWKRKYEIFKKNFLGRSSLSEKAKILNKENLYFDETKDSLGYHLIANSSKPLLIENKTTGYLITYDLVNFSYSHTPKHEIYTHYWGYMFFEDIVEKEKLNKRKITKNRTEAYKGSLQHFIKSAYNNTLTAEGFKVNHYINKDNPDYPSKERLKEIIKKQKETGIICILPPKKIIFFGREYKKNDFVTTINNQQFFDFDDYIFINYTKAKADKNYFNKSSTQASYLGLIDNKVQIFNNGYYYSPTHLISYDYMGWKKVGDTLPLDYEP